MNYGLLAANYDHDSAIIKRCQDFKVTGGGISKEWKNTDWINLVRQDKPDSSYKTKVKVLYSEKGIYFLFNCEDKRLTSTMKADNLN